MKAEYLIVGQGLAGSILAWTLDQRGHRVLILNDSSLPSASKASAGIFNPLTGKKLNRTWKADELFPFARQFYGDLQQKLGGELLHFCDIYRPFRSIEEQNAYLPQTAVPSLAKYVREEAEDEKYRDFIENPYGGLQITQSGWVDCVKVLEKIKEYFIEKGQYVEGNVNYESVDLETEKVKYENIEVEKVIFCEGYEARQNPFFKWLPFNPVKGQNLIALIEGYPINEIINQGTFVLPMDGKGKCRIGATYTWHDIDWQTTQDAKEFLEEKVKTYLKPTYQILEQQVGIRPSTKDRRPLVGLHPEYPQLAIFNGLGTKGVTLAPYFAEQFAKFLESVEELDPEVNIERVFSLYFRSE